MNLKISLLYVVLFSLVAPPLVGADPERIFSSSELASLDRENAMWRLLRIEDTAAANLRLLSSKGFTEDEVKLVRDRLVVIWEVDLERNFGWLSTEAIERIQEVDRKFVIRLRAVRLFEEVGIRAGSQTPETKTTLARAWQRAIRRELDYREITEFRLMNSSSAQGVAKSAKGMNMSPEEFRTLCEWQREFDAAYAEVARSTKKLEQAGRADGRLAVWEKERALLGDPRFAAYLARESPDFDAMNQAVARAGIVDPSVALDLWWIRKRVEIATIQVECFADALERRDLVSAKVRALLGREKFERYAQDDTARWLRW